MEKSSMADRGQASAKAMADCSEEPRGKVSADRTTPESKMPYEFTRIGDDGIDYYGKFESDAPFDIQFYPQFP